MPSWRKFSGWDNKPMTLDELEAYVQEEMDEILNQLQTVNLLNAQIEIKTLAIGTALQQLNQTVQTFINEQRQEG
jgi:hypothetical protein